MLSSNFIDFVNEEFVLESWNLMMQLNNTTNYVWNFRYLLIRCNRSIADSDVATNFGLLIKSIKFSLSRYPASSYGRLLATGTLNFLLLCGSYALTFFDYFILFINRIYDAQILVFEKFCQRKPNELSKTFSASVLELLWLWESGQKFRQ